MWFKKPEELWLDYSLPELTPKVNKGTKIYTPIVFYEVTALADQSCND